MPAFLLEIGVEEIPAGMIAAAQRELERGFRELVQRERLAGEGFTARSYSTPRRLAILAEGLLSAQADIVEQVVGPSTKVAFKDGVATPAAIAFAKKSGVEVAALETIQNAKGEYVAANVRRVGQPTAEVLRVASIWEVFGFSWPKNMYWRMGKPERFVRPIRWLLALLDEKVVRVELAGLTAGHASYGHRVLHGDAPVEIRTPQEYVERLAASFVQVDPAARKHRIRKALDAATRQIPGVRWREDEALVDTVTNLTEWPSVVLGGFDKSYLDLPEEVLVTVMRDHQKYFALEDENKKLLPNFLAVLNIEVDAAGAAIILHGNERVLRARFNDARFFWDQDQKIPLVDRVEMLKHVTFHKDLGSYWDKTEKNLRIAEELGDLALKNAHGLGSGYLFDKAALLLATKLAKADLTAELVKEFTELQGIVGGLYARAQGLGDIVGRSIYCQYKPASIDDEIPDTFEGVLLGLADRMQTIAAMFNIGLEPSGSKDPFALRRAGNAVAKIMATSVLSELIAVSDLVRVAVKAMPNANQELAMKLGVFLEERAEYYLEAGEGLPLDCIQAAMIVKANNFRDVAERARAVRAAKVSPDFLAISLSFKRIKKILYKALEQGDRFLPQPSESKFVHPAERQLWATALTWNGMTVPPPYYENSLLQAAKIRPDVDEFFDQVMVMDPDPELRTNRLALLGFVLNEFSKIADFSYVAA